MTFASTSFAASGYLRSASRRRTSGSASFASGFTGSYGRPAHNVSSFSCSRSWTTPPNTIAPIRPLPTGRARTHSAVPAWRLCRGASSGSSGWSEAGARYQRLSTDAGGAASPVSVGEDGDCVAATTVAATNAAARHAPAMCHGVPGAVLTSRFSTRRRRRRTPAWAGAGDPTTADSSYVHDSATNRRR